VTETLLDLHFPRPALRVRALAELTAPSPAVFRAVSETTAADLARGRTGLGARVARRLASEPNGASPLYAQMLGRGLRVLASDPLREVVLGFSPTLLRRGFVHDRRPASVGMGIRYDARRLTVEMRVRPRSPLTRLAAAAAQGPVERFARPLLDAWLDAVRARVDIETEGTR
jgi:hypothetical protein